jgi:hypothetical protein
LGSYPTNPGGCNEFHFEDHDVGTTAWTDWGIVIARNGSNHYAPTKPLKERTMVRYRKGLVYDAALYLKSMMQILKFEAFSEDEKDAWHRMYNVVGRLVHSKERKKERKKDR